MVHSCLTHGMFGGTSNPHRRILNPAMDRKWGKACRAAKKRIPTPTLGRARRVKPFGDRWSWSRELNGRRGGLKPSVARISVGVRVSLAAQGYGGPPDRWNRAKTAAGWPVRAAPCEGVSQYAILSALIALQLHGPYGATDFHICLFGSFSLPYEKFAVIFRKD